MIKFNADHKLVWEKITAKQAVTYIYFLNCEMARHMIERSLTDQKEKNALRERNHLLAASRT